MELEKPLGDEPIFRINLFGAPGFFWQAQPFKLTRRQARGLLYYLANRLQPVARARLCFLLWPDIPDAAARRNLSRLLNYLHTLLPHPDILILDHETVRLNADMTWSDAYKFSRLTERRLPEANEAAIGLYGGDFLQGFSLPKSPEFDQWLSAESARYEGVYLSTLAKLIGTKRHTRQLDAAIQYAKRYLEVDELAEEIHRQLISLYAQKGDQAAALRQFETCTLVLERELGVEPLPETRAAYDAVRLLEDRSPAPVPARPVWTVLPSLELPLIGREKAWKALNYAYGKYRGGGLITIRGEPGVGKSRLMQEFATSRESLALSGSCHASTQSLPYQPVTQALRQALSQTQLWAGIRPIWLAEAARLLPEISERFPDLPQAVEIEPAEARARLFEALTQCLLGVAAHRTILLCLDDLQWADDATLGWLGYLSGRLVGSNLCILAAYRTEGEDALVDLRQVYSRISLLTELSLSGIAEDAICRLLEQLPEPPQNLAGLAARINTATGGNPFFILETIRALLENNQLGLPEFELPLADKVQEAILRRLDRLSPVARQVLEAGAVLAPDLDQRLLWETAGRSELEVVDGLDELFRRQMLVDSDPLQLRHDLLTQVTYQHLSPWRRRLLHRRAAESLRERYRGKPDQAAAQIALHYDSAGDVENAVHFYYRAALVARGFYAHEEVIIYLQNAINLSSMIAIEWEEVAQFYEILGNTLETVGQYEKARQVYTNCLERIPKDQRLRRAEVKTLLASANINLNNMDEAEAAYQAALTLLDFPHADDDLAWHQVWLDIQLKRMGLFYLQAKLEQLEALRNRIGPVLDRFGAPDQHAQYFASQVSVNLHRERFDVSEQTINITKAELHVALDTGDLSKIATVKFRLGFTLLWSENIEEASGPLTEALELAERIGRIKLQCRCLVYLTCLHRIRGDLSGACLYAGQSLEIARQVSSVPYIGASLANLAWLDWCDQKIVAAERQASEALKVWEDYTYPFKWLVHWVLIAVYLDRDRLDSAVVSASAILRPNQQRLPDDVTTALQEGIECWKAGQADLTQKALERAVEFARKRGYL